MKDGVKIRVIGAGSSYTPELIEGCIELGGELAVDRISLMDIDPHKLNIIANLSRRMVKAASSSIEIESTQERRPAIEGADFVVSQIRVGGHS